MSGTNELSNAKNISLRYSEVVLPDGEPIHPRSKYDVFSSIGYCPNKDIKIIYCSFALNCCNEYPGILVLDVEINDDVYIDLLFVCLCRYENVIYCYLNKPLLPDRGKIYPS